MVLKIQISLSKIKYIPFPLNFCFLYLFLIVHKSKLWLLFSLLYFFRFIFFFSCIKMHFLGSGWNHLIIFVSFFERSDRLFFIRKGNSIVVFQLNFNVISKFVTKWKIVFRRVEMLSFASIINFIGWAFKLGSFYIKKIQIIKLRNTFLFFIYRDRNRDFRIFLCLFNWRKSFFLTDFKIFLLFNPISFRLFLLNVFFIFTLARLGRKFIRFYNWAFFVMWRWIQRRVTHNLFCIL